MFGYLRLFLAFLVLISHVDVRFQGLNPGVFAVVIFYILAGHVVARLWRDILSKDSGRLLRFYRDRVLRIFPLYIYILVLTVVFLAVTGYGQPQFSLSRLVLNLLIVPLNFYMVLDSTVMTNPEWCLVPPAWSLGAELQAYIILPLALGYGPLKITLALVSFIVYMMANFSLIHPDYFGYRLIPGVLFVFIVGTSLQGRDDLSKISRFDRYYPWVLWFVIGVSGLVFMAGGMFSSAYTRETFLGLFFGIPAVCLLGRTGKKQPGNTMAGALSYGVFLGHFLVIWILGYAGVPRSFPAYVPVIFFGSLAFAWLGVRWVETYVDIVRKK